MSEALSIPVYSWQHEDSALLSSSARALERAEAVAWSGPGVVRDLRALTVRTLVGAAAISSAPPEPDGPLLHVPDLATVGFPDAEHAALASALLSTVRVLTLGEAPRQPAVFTREGGYASYSPPPSSDAAGWQIGAAAIVAVAIGAAAYALAAAYLGEQTAFVADRALRRNQAGGSLVQTHASLLRLVELHAAAEVATGKTLPLNDAEKGALAALLNEHNKFLTYATTETPVKPPKGLGGFGLGAGLGLAALVGGVFLLRAE